jgi:hypothetical protein
MEGAWMPSFALKRWRAIRTDALNEIEGVYRIVASAGSRRRATKQQLNQAYTLLLSSEFQGFCRDLHMECVTAVVSVLPSAHLQNLARDSLLLSRKLDAGNPNPGNIGADFNRFDLSFWPVVAAAHSRNARRQAMLDELNQWRNAIAHNNFTPSMLRGGRPVLTGADVRRWRKVCAGLARWFDKIMFDHLRVVTGTNPW